MKYRIVIEPTSTGFSSYSPDLDGCIATGKSRQETIELMQEAIEFHLEGMVAAGYPIPQLLSEAAVVEVGV